MERLTNIYPGKAYVVGFGPSNTVLMPTLEQINVTQTRSARDKATPSSITVNRNILRRGKAMLGGGGVWGDRHREKYVTAR